MKTMSKPVKYKIIISGGGTGGHVFPAIAIADALSKMLPGIEILFIGALGRLEMEKVPAAGYKIIGLPVSGFIRKLSAGNIKVVLNLLKSLRQSGRIIKEFRPDAVVGVGGYASGPVLWVAGNKNIPVLIQEQNSYAGVTNKLLGGKAKRICVAYPEMDKYFEASKIVYTGNPVRAALFTKAPEKEKALRFFGLDSNKKTILIIGGSLGARTINNSILESLADFAGNNETQLLWQTGKFYYKNILEQSKEKETKNIKIFDFIGRMDMAYAAADIIVSRAGAGTISELALVGKPVILVPSPNVAEDHQTKNARALVKENAALLVADNEASAKLTKSIFKLLTDDTRKHELAVNIKKMAVHNSAEKIAEEVLKLIKAN